jgi:SAM-dependent methyltransferase
MPWDELESVLDVGSGMGAMAALLAAQGKTVIAVEAIPERALFQRKRAAQDGLPNWHPIIAGATSLPFPPQTFDLIAVHGAFGPAGLRGEGDPERTQRRLLNDLFRLLKPNGYIYADIEKKDRGWTRAPNRYQRMFTKAGFGSVEVFGVFDGCDQQKGVYRMSDVRPRRVTRDIVEPPTSWKRSLLRRAANAGRRIGLVEDDVVVFGRRSSKDGRLAWSGLPHDGPVTQFSTSDKVFALCFTGAPSSVFKGAKSSEGDACLEREHAVLLAASQRYGAEIESWPLRWPKPLGVRQLHGRRLYHYEFAQGSRFSNQLLPLSFDLARLRRLIPRLIDGYVELCFKMTVESPGGPPERAWEDLFDRFAASPVDESACSARIQEACTRLRRKRWATHLTHGDLTFGNTIVLDGDAMVLIDWECAEPRGLIAIDLMRLLRDAGDDSRLLKPRDRQAVMETTKQAVRDALGRLGVASEDYADVEALFVADQYQRWRLRDRNSGTPLRTSRLLEEYGRREFALA